MIIKESAENYLETIYMLKKQNGSVRSVDVAHHLGFSKPSVSVAMKSFREDGYVTLDEHGGLLLTDKGMAVATRVYEKHKVIAKALMLLGVSEQTAYNDSCKIEHIISDETFEKIKQFISNAVKD